MCKKSLVDIFALYIALHLYITLHLCIEFRNFNFPHFLSFLELEHDIELRHLTFVWPVRPVRGSIKQRFLYMRNYRGITKEP